MKKFATFDSMWMEILRCRGQVHKFYRCLRLNTKTFVEVTRKEDEIQCKLEVQDPKSDRIQASTTKNEEGLKKASNSDLSRYKEEPRKTSGQ